MKKILKGILCFTGLICVIGLCLGVPFSYVTNYKKVTVDTSNSSDGQHELVLQANMVTKDVVSSGKTSWSAAGNEKYYEVTGEK